RSQPMTSDLPNLQDIKARIETCDCPDVPVLVAALEAVIEDCQEIISDWDAEPVPDEFENGKALHAGDLLDLINQHLTIGDKQ
ncbi:MAG: hypothetical protein WAS05_00135, partial [Candidatus Nanopelagicales bacterium]